MRRIDHPTREAALGSVTAPPYTPDTPGYFDPGDPPSLKAASRVTARWLNGLQETLVHPIVTAAIALLSETDADPANWDYLTQAIQKLGFHIPLTSPDKTGSYTVIVGDRNTLLQWDTSAGAGTAALTAAATLGNGFAVAITRSGGNALTIDPNGSETIDGAATLALSDGETAFVVCDGTGWRVLARAGGAADTSTLRIDIDYNAARIALLEANGPLSLNDGVAFPLQDASDIGAGSANYQVGGGVVSNTYSYGANTVYTYTGSNDTHTVSAGISRILAKIWGGGGSGDGAGGNGSAGGGAGYAYAEIPVTPAEDITVQVGAKGGRTASGGDAGGGGGSSGVFRGTPAQGTALLMAGAGGGGADNNAARIGLAGGGDSGEATGYAEQGGPGTQSAGGPAGTGGDRTPTVGTAFAGGNGANADDTGNGGGSPGGWPNGGAAGSYTAAGSPGGGGGGGYFGGGGGDGHSGAGSGGGGGGGSGFSHASNLSTTLTAGAGTVPGNSGDGDRSGAGDGGAAGADGTDGRVLIAEGTASALTWITPPETADAAPTTGSIQCLISTSGVLNDTVDFHASSDGGTTWDVMTASVVGTIDGKSLVVASGALTGGSTTMQARIKTDAGVGVDIRDATFRWAA